MTSIIDPKEVDQAYRQLSTTLHRWEMDPSPENIQALQTAAAHAQAQSDAWEAAGAYGRQRVQQIHDLVQHVGAMIEMAQQHAGEQVEQAASSLFPEMCRVLR